MGKNNTFVKITNNDIYNKINEFIEQNQIDHEEMTKHLIKTNGKVTLNRWIATTALACLFLFIGAIVSVMFSN